MHVTILTIGSRGDVQPLIALGVGLQQAGYQVRLAASANFESLIRAQGLDFAVVEGNPQEFMQTEAAQDMMRSRNPIVFSRRLQEGFAPLIDKALLDSWEACQGTDAIITGGLAFWGIDIAEQLRIPCFFVSLQPIAPTSAFPATLFPPASKRFGGFYNRLTYTIAFRLIWQLLRNSVNQFRQSVLRLPTTRKPLLSRIRDRNIPLLNAVSPAVVPMPTDWTALDYMTGYFFLSQSSDFVPSAALSTFLADGSPPVYIGFGSMGGPEVTQAIEVALAALQETEQRGLLLTGWSNAEQIDLPANVFKVSSVPHDWLFPKMACIVHHGGAGTTAATFRSGRPGVIVPFLADQPFWSYRAFELGVSSTPIVRKHMTVEQLLTSISAAIHDSAIRDRASALGEKIRSEDGVGQAVEIMTRTIKP